MANRATMQTLPDPIDQSADPGEPGVLSRVLFQADHLLRNRTEVFSEIVEHSALEANGLAWALLAGFSGAAYGAAMGLHGGAMQAAAAAVKVPALMGLSLFAVLPALYAFNTMLGSRIRPAQLVALGAATLAATGVVLLALAPIALFLTFAGLSYSALKLAHVALFFLAGYSGAFFMYEGVQTVAARSGREQSLPVLQVWLLIYGYVGAQMSWMLRPFVGDPAAPFSLLRPLSGTFFSGVLDALLSALR